MDVTLLRRCFGAAAVLSASVLLVGRTPAIDDVDAPISIVAPPLPADSRIAPISLPTALKLANANPLDIAVAAERLQVALAQQQRANVIWVPSLNLGVDYARHDGRIQDIVGNVFSTSRSSAMIGLGPTAVFNLGDALYAPLAARQIVSARQSEATAACQDTLRQVGEAYVNVQQARGDVAGAIDVARRSADLLLRVEKLAPGFVPVLEVHRSRADAAYREQVVESAYERWQTASAELIRLLRLDAGSVVEPVEAPDLRIELVQQQSVDELIPIALTSRPELLAHQAIVQATLCRLRQEKIRPLVPSVLIRGTATNPGGAISSGYFGGGVNDNLSNFGGRNSMDFQLVWELQNLGLANRANVKEREAENRLALLELFRTQDRIAAEVTQAHAQCQRAAKRLRWAEQELKNATTSVELNVQGLSQTKRVGEYIVLTVRPQEVVSAVAVLDRAYRDYYSAIADFNRGQFRLYRALGHPAKGALATVESTTPSAKPLATNVPQAVAK